MNIRIKNINHIYSKKNLMQAIYIKTKDDYKILPKRQSKLTSDGRFTVLTAVLMQFQAFRFVRSLNTVWAEELNFSEHFIDSAPRILAASLFRSRKKKHNIHVVPLVLLDESHLHATFRTVTCTRAVTIWGRCTKQKSVNCSPISVFFL